MTSCSAGVHLKLSPINYAKKIFLALGGLHVHPEHPLATPMLVLGKILTKLRSVVCENLYSSD